MILALSAKSERDLIVQIGLTTYKATSGWSESCCIFGLDHAHHRLERGHIGTVAVERFVAERTTPGAPADQISRARISGGGP